MVDCGPFKCNGDGCQVMLTDFDRNDPARGYCEMCADLVLSVDVTRKKCNQCLRTDVDLRKWRESTFMCVGCAKDDNLFCGEKGCANLAAYSLKPSRMCWPCARRLGLPGMDALVHTPFFVCLCMCVSFPVSSQEQNSQELECKERRSRGKQFTRSRDVQKRHNDIEVDARSHAHAHAHARDPSPSSMLSQQESQVALAQKNKSTPSSADEDERLFRQSRKEMRRKRKERPSRSEAKTTRPKSLTLDLAFVINLPPANVAPQSDGAGAGWKKRSRRRVRYELDSPHPGVLDEVDADVTKAHKREVIVLD